MNTVYIPANFLSQVITDLQRYPLCNERYISLNPQWLPTEWDEKELQAEIPDIVKLRSTRQQWRVFCIKNIFILGIDIIEKLIYSIES